MEQSLKARLIGATVLVVLAVILVPELLSGRGPGVDAPAVSESPGSRTFTIEMGDSGARPAVQAPGGAAPTAAGNTRSVGTGTVRDPATEAQSPPAVEQDPTAAAPPEVPVVASAQPPAGGAAGRNSPATSGPAAPEAAVVEPAVPAPGPSAPPAGAGWLVQVGAFGSADAARSLVKELEAAGLAAHVSPVARGDRTLHRVRVGPVADQAEARQLATRLQARGLPATVVAGD
ncbi:MAG: SPOR domain-containing protein [Vicinamibacterales bacterium]|jgi:cell division septation protein DedD|nr:SPOR domain-containing protein [Vicinamibacterales bacterium]